MTAIVGYKRVSTMEQHLDRQLEGIELDECFVDRVSGNSCDRPGLNELKTYIRKGDKVIVHSMDRLARNLKELRSIVDFICQKGVEIHFVKENLTFNGDDSPLSNLLLPVIGAVAEFERNLIKERQMEGIRIAKEKGIYKGKKRLLTREQISDLKHKLNSGDSKAKLAKEYGISRVTIYRYLKEKKER